MGKEAEIRMFTSPGVYVDGVRQNGVEQAIDENQYYILNPDEYFKLWPQYGKPSSLKPPSGIEPKYIWEEKRLETIDNAIKERLGTLHNIPEIWMDERRDLIEIISKRNPST